MKKLIKRIVPILLSVFMLFGVLDTPVYAISGSGSAEENSDGNNSDKEGSQSLNVSAKYSHARLNQSHL